MWAGWLESGWAHSLAKELQGDGRAWEGWGGQSPGRGKALKGSGICPHQPQSSAALPLPVL